MGEQVKVDINDPELDAAFDMYEQFIKTTYNTTVIASYHEDQRLYLREEIVQAVVNAVLKSLTAMEKKGEGE